MLFWLYPHITQNYFILSFLLCLGTLQWTAARNHKPTISWLGMWGLGRSGRVVGAGLIGAGFIWFFTQTPGLFNQGLAGGELSTLFVTGGLSALAVARLAGAFWLWIAGVSSNAKGETFLPRLTDDGRPTTGV